MRRKVVPGYTNSAAFRWSNRCWIARFERGLARVWIRTSRTPAACIRIEVRVRSKQITEQGTRLVRVRQFLSHDRRQGGFRAVRHQLHRVRQSFAARRQTFELFPFRQFVPLEVFWRGLHPFFQDRQLVLQLLDLFLQIAFLALPFRDFRLFGLRVKRQGCKASLTLRQLALDGPGLPVQFPPGRVDYRPCGPRNRFRSVFTKCINSKVFHHVAEEVFLGPSAEEGRRIF